MLTIIKLTAELTLLPTEQGGRSSPLIGGRRYRPAFSIGDPERMTSLVIEAIRDRYQLGPGETGVIEGALARPEMFEGRLSPGTPFQIQEGGRLVGHGNIRAVRDVPILEIDASRWTKILDIYEAIHRILGAPAQRGENLNALPETMLWDHELNAVQPPYHLSISGTEALPSNLSEHLVLMEHVIYHARVEYNASTEKQLDVVLVTGLV